MVCTMNEDMISRKHTLACIVAVLCLLSGCKKESASSTASPTADPTPSPISSQTTTATSPNSQNTIDVAQQDLQAIGTKAAKAVLANDGKALLPYLIDENRDYWEEMLQNRGTLFDKTVCDGCKGRSVYQIVSSARQLQIEASVTRSKEGRLYGLLLFYDRSQVTEQQLQSNAYLSSDEALRQVSSWHFELINGKWQARTLFDEGTEGLCGDDD